MSASTGPVLALDSGSPRVSVAIGHRGEVLAQRSAEVARSSTYLLRMIDDALAEAGLVPSDLAGVAALAGPGSFTGLRIGLATALGLHQALRIAATALPTLAVLAAQVPPDPGATREAPGDSGEVPADSGLGSRTLAVVDVLRGEWAVQEWQNGRGGPMEILTGAELARRARLASRAIVGFDVYRLAAIEDWPSDAVVLQPGPLAPTALGLLPPDLTDWDPARLTAPIYGRPPAVTKPRPRAAVAAR